jgi:hypothetical protein
VTLAISGRVNGMIKVGLFQKFVREHGLKFKLAKNSGGSWWIRKKKKKIQSSLWVSHQRFHCILCATDYY